MPTVRENIAYASQHFMLVYRGTLLRVARAVALLVLVAALLEVFVFNFNYFASAGYRTINLENRLDMESEDGTYALTSIDHVLEFSHLNTEIHNIKVDFAPDQPAQNVTLKIQFTDAAHLTYFDSTEYTVGVPPVDVSTMGERTQYINLQTAGLVENLRIEVVGDEVSYPILLDGIYLNAHRPFEFSLLRFGTAVGILLLGYAFRPGSAIYRIRIVENPRKSKVGIIFAVTVEVALLTSFLLFGSNLVGVATSSYNYGSWDGTSLVNTFEVGGDNAQQYAELARAMAEGRLYLEEEPPAWLQEMNDPYDKGARDELQKETGEKYLFDVAYYEGRYYVYFGVVPVLLFYLPFYLLTGANFPTAIGVLVMAIAFVLGATALLDRFARYHFRSVSLGVYLLLQIPTVACSGILYLAKFPTFYSLPIMCGVLGVGPILLDALAAVGPSLRVAVRRLAVHGASGRVPPAAAGAVASGLPAVLAHLHHRAPPADCGRRAGVRLPGGALRAGGCRHHGVQLRALRIAHRLRGQLQPHGERHDEARYERRSSGPGLFRLLLAAALHDRGVSLLAAGALRHHLYGADHPRGHLRRHLRLPAHSVGARVLAAHLGDARAAAVHTHYHGRDHHADRVGCGGGPA